ncbi:MAG: S8 family serine peptidase, partial [Candidatus Sedimenticola sp. (ex Thyasira tokunagai)]
AYYQGTSMATPHVAGVAALMLSVKPELTPGDVENLLKSSARAFPKSCSKCGTGILNAGDAVAAAQAFTGGDGGDSGDGGDKCRGGPKKCPR